MAHLWVPKKRRKCKDRENCGWIGYSVDKCPYCGKGTTEAEPYDPSQNMTRAIQSFRRRPKYYVVGIDLRKQRVK